MELEKAFTTSRKPFAVAEIPNAITQSFAKKAQRGTKKCSGDYFALGLKLLVI
jgi:hypothetical protein